MKIRVGILATNVTAWQALLGQIGVPCGAPRVPFAPAEWSALVLADDADDAMIVRAREYLRAGGGILCSARARARLTGARAPERSIRYLLQDDAGGLFPAIGLVDLYTPCAVSHDANAVCASDGRRSVFAGDSGGGFVVALPVDAGSFLGDARSITKSFWADRRRLPHERVALVSRGGLRKLVTRSLEYLHHRRGLPFLHLWHFPGEAPSLSAFRIDTDFASRAEVEALHALLARHALGATWFVHVEGQEELLPFYARMEGHEIGTHCFAHRAFDREELIEADLAKAAAAFAKSGMPVRGYAGPYGRWNAALSRSIARRGFEYSSEFSYDYDNLPSVPPSAEGSSRPALQVPVHPISIGNLRRQGCSSKEMLAYFSGLAERSLAAGDPLFFYHHPKNLHHDVLDGLFALLRERGVAPVLLGDYARWWKRRAATPLAAGLDGELLELSGPAAGGDVRCRVSRGDGTECLVDPGQPVDFRLAPWKPTRAAYALPRGVERIRAFNPWITLNRLEDALYRKFFS